MLKPLVLEFTDDIPRSQFWTGFTIESLFISNIWYTFRVPEHLGKEAAYKRLADVFKIPVEEVCLIPATPALILEWLKDHKREAQYRKGVK